METGYYLPGLTTDGEGVMLSLAKYGISLVSVGDRYVDVSLPPNFTWDNNEEILMKDADVIAITVPTQYGNRLLMTDQSEELSSEYKIDEHLTLIMTVNAPMRGWLAWSMSHRSTSETEEDFLEGLGLETLYGLEGTGDLTDLSYILTDGQNDWWYSGYMIHSYIDDLIRTGECRIGYIRVHTDPETIQDWDREEQDYFASFAGDDTDAE